MYLLQNVNHAVQHKQVDTKQGLTYNSEESKGGIINTIVGRITVLWALSEAALGGVLHALHIPLTGLFIGSGAVIFISLIGYYSDDKKDIFKSVLIVLLVKAGVSPYTPPAAYFAVSLQGIIGTVLFFSKKFYNISTIVFGIVVLTMSSVQKVLVMTLVYGKNLWDSIDHFGRFVTDQLPFLGKIESVSFLIIGVYSGVHIIAGLFSGIIASRLPRWIEKYDNEIDLTNIGTESLKINGKKKKRKRRIWLRRPSGILIIFLAIGIIILTYVFPHFSESVGMKAVVMIIRSVVIMSLWFFLLSPWVLKLYKNFFNKKKGRYSDDVKSVINLLPFFKAIVIFNWKRTSGMYFPGRIKEFLSSTFVSVFKVKTGEEK